MILSRDEILNSIKEGRIAITPFYKNCVGPCSVDLHLGKTFKVFEKVGESKKTISVREDADFSQLFKKVELKEGEKIVLYPGELVLGITEERITLGKDVCARIDGRTRFARIGLLVHVSASLVQPGCDNHQVLEIINMSPHEMKLSPGLKVCQIVFEELKGKAEYSGKYKKQKQP